MAMYQPLHEKTAVQQVGDWVANFSLEPDGLVVTPGENLKEHLNYHIDIPARLREWLLGLRLLRGVPLTHLVPDPALLPPESIRFFHVDPTWTDRLVDGAISAGGLGTSDITIAATALTLIRNGLDDDLAEIAQEQEPDVPWQAGKDPMTGMLIRSELVRRWPELVIRAGKPQGRSAGRMAILRREVISRDVMIALFAGQPTRVEVREPDVAMRFGVEPGNQVNLRGYDGTYAKGIMVNIPWHKEQLRVLSISGTVAAIKATGAWQPGEPNRDPGSRDVALNLEQLPYVQVFTTDEAESEGSKPIGAFESILGKPAIQLRHGRFVHVEKVTAQTASSAVPEEVGR